MPPKKKPINKKRAWISALVVIGVFLLGVLLLNLPYFALHARYALEKPEEVPPAEEVARTWDPNTLVIERLDIIAPVIYIEERTEAAYQEALKHGVVHFPGTAMLGAEGNVYIFGHSSDYAWSHGDYKTVFALLTKIEIGDRIVVTDADGLPYTYIVTESFVVAPDDLSVLEQPEGEYRLTLQTSYPIGTALKRFIVVAELEGTESDSL